jgi:hypothetical protein
MMLHKDLNIVVVVVYRDIRLKEVESFSIGETDELHCGGQLDI